MPFVKSILLGLFAVLAATGVAAAQEWREYRSVAGRYSVEMPGKPDIETEEIEVGDEEVPMIQAIVGRDEATYLAAHMDFPPETVRDVPPQKVLENARDGAVEGHRLRSDRALTVAGQPAREFVIEQPEGVVLVMRAVLAGVRLYQMVVVTMSPGGTAERADTRRFFDSFKLVPPTP